MDSQESSPADRDKDSEGNPNLRRRKVVECAKDTLDKGPYFSTNPPCPCIDESLIDFSIAIIETQNTLCRSLVGTETIMAAPCRHPTLRCCCCVFIRRPRFRSDVAVGSHQAKSRLDGSRTASRIHAKQCFLFNCPIPSVLTSNSRLDFFKSLNLFFPGY